MCIDGVELCLDEAIHSGLWTIAILYLWHCQTDDWNTAADVLGKLLHLRAIACCVKKGFKPVWPRHKHKGCRAVGPVLALAHADRHLGARCSSPVLLWPGDT
jgi:hypothetical protein